MSNKKSVRKLLAVALLSTIGLAACSNDIQAKPSNYDDNLITFSDSQDEIYHNLISIIDDAYRDGTLASEVLDKVLYTYSVSVFGRYNRIAKPYNLGEGEITLKEAAAECAPGYTGEKTKANAFIEKHKAFWTTDNDGNRKDDSASREAEYDRVYAKWTTIEERISRAFYSTISGGGYNNNRGYFSEKKYLADLKSQLHKVLDPYKEGTEMTLEEDKVVITPDVQEEEVFFLEDGTQSYLHRKNYQDEASWQLNQTESLDTVTARYIEDEIIPTIYRTLLVEQYLLDESYNNLGRSAARKVNILAISSNSNNDKGANYLMKYFVRNKISVKGAEITLDSFKEVSNAVKGLVDDAQKNDYLDALNATEGFAGAYPKRTFQGYDSQDYSYYLGTDYGDMMSSFEKIKTDINTTDSGAESDFTGSYTYSAEVGKEIKTNSILKNDYTVDGWYIKSTGITDLPDTIKSRLFNIGVANVLDDNTVEDRFAGETYAVPAGESKLVAKINGKHYLKVGSKQSGADPKDDILFYEGGKYYVIQIEEAVSGSKLAKETTGEAKYTSEKKEDIINNVARVIANNDTYQSSSTKHWLEEAEIKYHDTKIYDYFKDNYPDLFD